jgi:hypothetical protein
MKMPCGAVFDGPEVKAIEAEEAHKKCTPGKCLLKKDVKKEEKKTPDRTWV